MFERITIIYIVLLFSVFLFYCGVHGYQEILSAKAQTFYLICGGYVLVCFALALEGIIIGEIRPPSAGAVLHGVSWFQAFVALYLIFTWLSALFSPYRSVTILGASRYEGALTITIYGLSCLLVSRFGRLDRRLFHLLLVSSATFSLLCIPQLHGGNPFHLYPEGYNYAGAYIDYAGAYLGTLGNVDIVAAFLAIEIPILTGAMVKGNGRVRALVIVPLFLAIYVLLKMDVLAGIVGAVCGIIISLPVLLPQSKRERIVAWCTLAIVAVLSVVFLYLTDIGSGMLHEAHELLHGNMDPNFGSGRLHIWAEVLRRVPSQLWFGSGPDTMLLAEIESFSRYDSLHGINIVSKIDVAHNEYLNILFHQGVFALASYLTLLGLTVRNWIAGGSSNRTLGVLGAGAAGYCVQAFFGFSMCITAPFFWLLLGLINGATYNVNGGIYHAK